MRRIRIGRASDNDIVFNRQSVSVYPSVLEFDAAKNNMMFYNRYRLLRKLGRGSFGEVWAAHDEVTDVEVAVKIYAALDNSGIEDFRSVYRNLSALIHTNILRPDYYDVYEGRPFLVMPLCRGSVQEQVGDMSEQELWCFIRDVSSGLAYLHSHDVIHNDIKPANILINTYGDYVVSDPSIEEATATVAYCAPELFMMENLSVSNAIDIWALGATLYELMTGEKLFSGQGGVAQLNGAALPELPDIYSRELREIVLSCLARESENRVSAERLKTVASKSVLRYQVFDTVGKHSDRDVRTLLRQMPKIGGSGVINNVCSGKNITVKKTFADGNMRILYGVTDDYGKVLVDFEYDYLEDFGVCYLPAPGPINIHGRFIGAFYKQGDCVGYLRIKENGDIEEFTRWTQKEFYRLSTLT